MTGTSRQVRGDGRRARGEGPKERGDPTRHGDPSHEMGARTKAVKVWRWIVG